MRVTHTRHLRQLVLTTILRARVVSHELRGRSTDIISHPVLPYTPYPENIMQPWTGSAYYTFHDMMDNDAFHRIYGYHLAAGDAPYEIKHHAICGWSAYLTRDFSGVLTWYDGQAMQGSAINAFNRLSSDRRDAILFVGAASHMQGMDMVFWLDARGLLPTDRYCGGASFLASCRDLAAQDVYWLGQRICRVTTRQIAAPPGRIRRPFLVFRVEQGKKGDLIMYDYAYGNGRDGCDLKFLDRSFWAGHGASQPGCE
jgi:hypothetical protein